MWTKIENRGRGARARTKFGVSKGNKSCFLLIPHGSGFKPGGLVEYFKADGKLAFAPSCEGFATYPHNKRSLTLRANIPAILAHHFPAGTTDIEVTRDGDMYVIDLSQFPTQEAAQ